MDKDIKKSSEKQGKFSEGNCNSTSSAVHLTSACYLNSFKSLIPYAKSTGLRTAQIRFNSFGEDQKDIAAEFLLNSVYRRGDREFELSVTAYFEDTALAMVSRVGDCALNNNSIIKLPNPLPLPMMVQEAIAKRRSQRDLSGEQLELDQLSTILQCAGGVTAMASTQLKQGDVCKLPLRATPSGGGLYPIDIYLAVNKVRKLDSGLYRFLNKENGLVLLNQSTKNISTLIFESLPGKFMDVKQSSAVIILVMRSWRSKRKYLARGLRFSLMETGYISQNIHIASTALGTLSCDYGGFYDDEINKILGLDGVYETAIHIILLGA